MEEAGRGRSGWAERVWLNGEMVPGELARISVFDSGFLLGDGVYETVRARAGNVFRWPAHRIRLEESLSGARIRLPFPISTLDEGISRCLEANLLRDARIRLTVSRGEGGPGNEVPRDPRSATVVIAASSWRPLSEEKYREGVAAIVPRIRQTGRDSLDPAVKSTSRLHLVLARLEASERGAFEAILLGGEGEVTEGTSSNVFLVKGGKIRTPSLETGILAGVTREAVLELALAAGIPCEQVRLPREDLLSADEIFLTNTSWNVLPVSRLDGEPVGSGRTGAVASDLRSKLDELVERECAR